MRIAVVDDVPADREKLAADIVSWAREQGLPADFCHHLSGLCRGEL